MRSKHLFLSLCVGVALTILIASQAFAGGMEGPADLTDGVICDPTVWAVVVVKTNGSDYKVMVRAKKIEDCVVTKDTYFVDFGDIGIVCDDSTTPGLCPLVESDFINYVFDYGPPLLGIEHPVVTKIKNFDSKGPDTDNYTLISFDAQLKAYYPGLNACPTP